MPKWTYNSDNNSEINITFTGQCFVLLSRYGLKYFLKKHSYFYTFYSLYSQVFRSLALKNHRYVLNLLTNVKATIGPDCVIYLSDKGSVVYRDCKVASSTLSQLVAHSRTVYKGEI